MSLKSLLFGTDEANGVKYSIAANTRDWLPMESIQNGIVKMKDGRYVKLAEITPVNFYLKSYRRSV